MRILMRLLASLLVLAGAAVYGTARADEPKQPQPPQEAPAGENPDESIDVSQILREAWPDRPEWLDMYTAIIADEEMGPQYGWFRTAVTQTRYPWVEVQKKYDKDKNEQIARSEFPGSDHDFARIDRDRDGALTQTDFDFTPRSPISPSGMIFSRVDRDGNGKLTREEIDGFFKKADTDSRGFLSRSDVDALFAPPSASSSGGDRPSKAMLIRGLFNQEIGSLQAGPHLNEKAPDFRLKTNDGQSEVALSSVIGPKPVVLIFGNFTCGPFRSHAGNFEKLYQRYKDRATFVMVYVREAHPTDGWRMDSNDNVGVSTAQPTTYEERAGVAQRCGKLLGLGFPMLVDTIDDAVGAKYSGMPGRFYLIDHEGKIAFKNARGPYGFKPDELEQSLVLLLQDENPSDSNARRLPISQTDPKP